MPILDENPPKLSNNMFNALVCRNIIGVFIAAPDGHILDANDKYLEIIGYSREDLRSGNINWMALTPSEYRNKDLAALKELYENGYSSGLEKEYRRKDGSRVPIIMGAGLVENKVGNSKTCNYIGFIVDLSKQKRVEQQLREKEALQSRAEQIAHFGAYELSIGNNLEYKWSDEACRIFGLTPQESMSYDRYLTFLRPDDRERVTRAVISSINTKEPFDIEYRITRNDGQERTIYSKTEVVLNKDGDVIRLIGTIHDITDRRKAEKALIDARDQSEMYLDLMGHDINNINQIARGYLEMARDQVSDAGGLDKNSLEYIDKPLEALENVARLIENVRKLRKAHDSELKMEKIDLGEVLKEIQKEYSRSPNKQVMIDYTPVECRVMANVLIRDVFANLVGNAVKHSKGTVAINIEVTGVKKENVDYHRVAVEDNGPGISDARKEQVFKRFEQGNKIAGSGLGLYLVKTLVDGYGGKIWVEDRVRGDHMQGCRFVVLLPAV